MYHSLTFTDPNNPDFSANTYEDWHLVPTSRPVFNPPNQKQETIDLPGADGFLDLSTALTGYPVYDNRVGSIEFAVLNDYEDWMTIYTRVMAALHGRTLRVTLEDEPEYFYEGRFTVNEWKSNNNGTWSNITIDYSVIPYKLDQLSSIDEWLWDTFNFETGVIRAGIFGNIEVDGTIDLDFTGYIGRRPVVPVFHVSIEDGSEITMVLNEPDIRIINLTKNLKNGDNEFYDVVLCGLNDKSSITMSLTGHGIVSIDFRSGEL